MIAKVDISPPEDLFSEKKIGWTNYPGTTNLIWIM